MTIAAFVHPEGQDRHLAIDLAIAIAEYSIVEHRTLYLLTDAAAALELGLALIGMRAPRTIEGGQYNASPIRLLPFLPRPGDSENGPPQPIDDDGVGGEIEELRRLGLFAYHDENDVEVELTGEPVSTFEEVILKLPELIIGLGANSSLWQAVYDALRLANAHSGLKVVSVEGFAPSDIESRIAIEIVSKDENARVQRTVADTIGIQSHFLDDGQPDLVDENRRAYDNGLLVAGLLEFLLNSESV